MGEMSVERRTLVEKVELLRSELASVEPAGVASADKLATRATPHLGKVVAREALKEPVESRDVERLPPALKEVEASICSCGNVFMPDAVYCRQCGKPRGANTTL